MVDYLRSKDPLFAISTDIIVWFSGETEEMFEMTKNAFKECEFDFTYNARYSVRKWTIAEKIYPDDITNDKKADRWHILNDILLENVTSRNSMMLDREEKVLISWEKEWKFIWRTRNFKEVRFPKTEWVKIWDLVKVKITELDRYVLKWELIN
jgi:tRNA-2-methylthio-N6-dimethylallyladenosine synthase